MARNESPTKKKQSEATLRALAATQPIPQTFGLGKAARKETVALNKKARKARQVLGRSIKQEPRDDKMRTRLRRASDSPPLQDWVEDRGGAATTANATDRCAPLEAGSGPPVKVKKGSQGDISKRKMAMKAAKREARAKKKAANVQLGAWERAKGAKRRIEEMRRVEQSLERQKEAHKVMTESHAPEPPSTSSGEVDGVLNHLEPLLRTIYKTQSFVQASTSNTLSFTAASPSPHFIHENLGKARPIVQAYESRSEETLTPLQMYALRLARLALEELEYMERSDDEEGRRRSWK